MFQNWVKKSQFRDFMTKSLQFHLKKIVTFNSQNNCEIWWQKWTFYKNVFVAKFKISYLLVIKISDFMT